MTIDTELLLDLMTAFEQGKEDSLFEFENLTPQVMAQIDAFAQMAAHDTDKAAELLRLPSSDDKVAFVIAGIMQGLWLGYEYAKRERT